MPSILDILSPLIKPVLDEALSFIPNPEEKQKAKLAAEARLGAQSDAILKATLDANAAQIDIDKAEVASGSVFMGGWRSFIGWGCGFAFLWSTLLEPMLTYFIHVILLLSHSSIVVPPLPTLETGQLYPVMTALLGLGGLHVADLHSQRTSE